MHNLELRDDTDRSTLIHVRTVGYGEMTGVW